MKDVIHLFVYSTWSMFPDNIIQRTSHNPKNFIQSNLIKMDHLLWDTYGKWKQSTME